MPRNPLRFSATLTRYRPRYEAELGTLCTRTAADKCALLAQFRDLLGVEFPSVNPDPWAHEIDSRHADAFLREQQKREGKRKTADGAPATAAPATRLKKLSDLR